MYSQEGLPVNYRPSVEDAEWFINYWKGLPSYSDQELALDKLFTKLCPENKCIEDILIKCSALNDFYSTNIFDVHAVAEHILNVNNIDERLQLHDYSLVDEIAHVTINGKGRNFYSFATKYCSHHQPEYFAIYDSYVEKVLVSLNNNESEQFANFRRSQLKDNYRTYMNVIHSFRDHFGLTKYSIKKLDQYLWQLGKWYFNQYGLSFKYYNRESESPYPKDSIQWKMWHGEMMFVTTHQSVGYWKEKGKEWLIEASEQIQNLAAKLTPEQFGVVTYIFKKCYPCDEKSWIINY